MAHSIKEGLSILMPADGTLFAVQVFPTFMQTYFANP